jgi:hypothetical protein
MPGIDLQHLYTDAEMKQRAVAFDRVDRRAFLYPTSAVQSFDLIQLTDRELNGGVITGVGIDSPEWDFFARDVYLFTLQRVQPTGQQLRVTDGTLASELQFMRFRGIGSVEEPKQVWLPLLQKYVWTLFIPGRAGAPATGFRVVNLFIRTVGFLFR